MIRRILTIVERYVLLYLRAPARLLDIFFWPIMELFVWGFLALYLKESQMDQTGYFLIMLINGLIFWDLLFRSQQAVSLSFMEELWTRNVLNILISPLRIWEWVVGSFLYGIIKTGIVIGILFVLATLFYSYDITVLGFYLIPFMFNLLVLGLGMGLFTTGLLVRWGHAAEALIWGVPFLLQPFSAIFYPLSIYPKWLQSICVLLPSTHVMEGMREVVNHQTFSWNSFWLALGLNVIYIVLCLLFFIRMLERGRENGQLVRMTG